MKRLLLVSFFVLCGTGCNGVNRLLGGPDDGATAPETVMNGNAPAQAPEFNVATPVGMTKEVYFGAMPSNGVVSFPAVAGSTVKVFIYQAGVSTWFQIGPLYSQAFYYTYSESAGTVEYHGQNIGGTAYCVYRYIP